jgi:hypothetical protein
MKKTTYGFRTLFRLKEKLITKHSLTNFSTYQVQTDWSSCHAQTDWSQSMNFVVFCIHLDMFCSIYKRINMVCFLSFNRNLIKINVRNLTYFIVYIYQLLLRLNIRFVVLWLCKFLNKKEVWNCFLNGKSLFFFFFHSSQLPETCCVH